MTVSQTVYKNTYTGDGADVTFNFSFEILDESHILVQVINSTGTLQTKTIDIDYTVSGIGNTDSATDYTSGTITFSTAPLSTDTVIIKRNVPLDQETDYIEHDTFPADTHEEALDKLTLITQQMQEQLDRCFKLDYTGEDTTDFTLPNPVANYYLRFNDDADGLEAVANTGTIGLDNIVEDPSPQLGGNLDVNGNQVVSTSNANISITPDGTGEIRLNSDTVTVEDKIEHAGDTDTYINFTTNALDFLAGNVSVIDMNASGLRIGGTGSRITAIADENDLVSNSDTKLATQQSIKAYVDDTTVNSGNSALQADLDVVDYDIITSSGNKDIDINPHGSGSIVLTTDTGGLVEVTDKIAHYGDTNNLISFTTDAQDYQTGGSSRLDISNSGVRLGAANARVTTIYDDDGMVPDSATALATQQSIKAYVDNKSATQAQMETGTSTTTYVSPGRQQFHESAVKFWCELDTSAATATLENEYNISSITDNGADVDVNFDVDFSATNYVVFVGFEEVLGSGGSTYPVRSRSTGSVNIEFVVGYEYSFVMGLGDQ